MEQALWAFGYFALLLSGWWLPAVIYFGAGLFFIATVRRAPYGAVAWLISFLALFGYTAYEGIYLKARLEQRAQTYRDFVKFAEVPNDVTAIMLSRSQESDALTGYAQSCSVVCVKLLLDGRFKQVIIAFKDGLLFAHDDNLRRQALANYREPKSYNVFTVVNEPGCENYNNADMYQELEAWRVFGRCVHMRSVNRVEGRYLEITTNEDTPERPPWPVRFTTHVRLADSGTFTNIARAEYASVNLAYWFPVPGISRTVPKAVFLRISGPTCCGSSITMGRSRTRFR